MTVHRGARSGMTLLEVIVALTVAGAALAAGAAVLGFLTDQQDRSGAQRIASANAVRAMVRAWASGTRLSTEGDAEFRGVPRGHTFGGTMSTPVDEHVDDQLTFITSAPTDVAPSGTRVHIYMNHDDTMRVRGLVAELRPWRRAGAPMVVSLAPDATGFRAQYLSSLFSRRIWQDSWISTSVLPSAVELRIMFDTTASAAPTDRAAHALLSVPMTIVLAGRR
ncbi:MAG TPA: prepilin-type N-terminal cleavage/methylation domain-containing protein [Gemmatimonadaceae bacterium]